MQKTFNAFEKATVKNSAKAVAHYQAKNETIDKKIKELEAEKEMNNAYIEQYSVPVRELTGGYDPLELCEKVSHGSQNDWVFKYPATIIPPVTTVELIKEDEEREREKKEKEEQASTIVKDLDEDENKDIEEFYAKNNIVPEKQQPVEDPFAEEQEEFPAQEDDDKFNPDEF